MSLTRAEKNEIIINDAKGILHPDYYVCHTKTGGVQVRKRKTPLNIKTDGMERPEDVNALAESSSPVKERNYDTVTNKQLLDMMLQILDKTTECKDENLNDVEREKETKENEEFAEGMKMRAEKVINDNLPEQKNTVPEIKPQRPQLRVNRRKGRNLLR